MLEDSNSFDMTVPYFSHLPTNKTLEINYAIGGLGYKVSLIHQSSLKNAPSAL
jgi:hypothetical protein